MSSMGTFDNIIDICVRHVQDKIDDGILFIDEIDIDVIRNSINRYMNMNLVMNEEMCKLVIDRIYESRYE